MAKTDLVERAKAIVLREPTSLAALRRDAADLVEAAKTIDSAESGKGVLDQLEVFNMWCQRLKADTPTMNVVHRARFDIKAKVGQYLPPREVGGRGKSSATLPVSLSKQVIADCRWIYDHNGYIDPYFSGLDDEEASLPKFRSYVTSIGGKPKCSPEDERIEENEDVGKRPASARLLAVKNSPLILLGPKWFAPKESAQVALDEVDEKGSWELSQRLDPSGSFAVFRTMGSVSAFERAIHLRRRWGLLSLGWQINVSGLNRFGKHASESLLVCTVGKPEIPKALPTLDSNDVKCPAAGIEALIYSWFADFIEAKGTPNLVIEIGGVENHKGYQLLTIEDLEAEA